MISKHQTVISVILATLVFGGCAGFGEGGYGLPAPIAQSASSMPPDARAAAAAVEQAVRGAPIDRVPGVRLAPGARVGGVETNFVYEGFTVTQSSLLRYTDSKSVADGRFAAGTLVFEDSIGRLSEVIYATDYRLKDGGIEIGAQQAAPLFSTSPQALMFVVPMEAVARVPGGLSRVHSEFFRFVVANAIDWVRADQIPRGQREYMIFVMLLDRVSPSATFEVKLSETASDPFGYKDSSKYLDFNGWRVGFVPGRFALDRARFYVKAVFTPGEEIGFAGRNPRLVGTFPMDLEEARKHAAKVAMR